MTRSTRPIRIAIFSDRPGWHTRRLERAFAAWPTVDTCRIDPQRCAIDLNRDHGLFLPGCEDRLPDGVFVRGIPAGSFEQVTLRLSILHELARLGVVVYNDATAIERTVDKAMTGLLLHAAGLPTPASLATDDADQIATWRASPAMHQASLVIKPLFGAEGEGLVRIGPDEPLAPAATGGLWYLQRFIETVPLSPVSDIRVLVIGHRARFAMRRISRNGWITNVARGARVEACELSSEHRRLAEAASLALQTDYAGVDIIDDAHGQSWLLEVNSVPAWKGLQSVVEADIAAAIAQDFIERRLVERR